MKDAAQVAGPAPHGRLARGVRAAFAAVLVLHGVVAWIGHFGQQRAADDLASLDSGRRSTQAMLGVERLVVELQRDVQGYTQTGNRSLAARASQTHDQLAAVIGGLPELVAVAPGSASGAGPAAAGAREDAADIAAMQASLARYHAQFQAAVEDRQRRQRLVDHDLVTLAAAGQAALAAWRDGADAAAGAPWQQAQLRFAAAQLGAHGYVSQLDSSAMQRAHAALAELRGLVPPEAGARSAAAAALLDVVARFERVLVGLVQSTRSYLHLVHVVLAAEAQQILAQAAALRDRHLQWLARLQQTIRDAQEQYQWQAAVFSLATIGLGLLAGWWVGRAVVRPLGAITATLGQLARGEAVAAIPGRERDDEIGAMAAAAEVLRERNVAVTELLAGTERLTRQQERNIADLEQKNRELDGFVHVASHDLKAPLRAMGTIVRWIEEDCGDALPPVGRDHLVALRQRVTRMNRLLEDLQVWSRAGRGAHERAQVDVQELVHGVVELVGLPDAFRIEITGAAPSGLTWRVPLEQVLANLLSNAIKHHDRGTGTIGVHLATGPAVVHLRVTDDGPGIPPRYHALVFEPFRTLQSRDALDTSGVGLAIVRRLVDRYGGTVQIESPLAGGRGAAFVLQWPLDLQAEAARPPGALVAAAPVGD